MGHFVKEYQPINRRCTSIPCSGLDSKYTVLYRDLYTNVAAAASAIKCHSEEVLETLAKQWGCSGHAV